MKGAYRKPRWPVFDVEPGKEEEFRYLERALALSDWLDRLIEATEPICPPEPLPVLTAAPNLVSVSSRQREVGAVVRAAKAIRPRGLRAGFASRLTRLALALHREAATETALQPRTECSS